MLEVELISTKTFSQNYPIDQSVNQFSNIKAAQLTEITNTDKIAKVLHKHWQIKSALTSAQV